MISPQTAPTVVNGPNVLTPVNDDTVANGG
jgi:hypothetical protein